MSPRARTTGEAWAGTRAFTRALYGTGGGGETAPAARAKKGMDPHLPPEARARQRAAAGLLHALLVLALVGAVLRRGLGSTRPAPLPPPVTVDLAHDPAWRLRLLPGIGPRRAQALLEHRASHGPPRRLSDLLAVPGIGPVGIARLAALTEARVTLDGRPLPRSR